MKKILIICFALLIAWVSVGYLIQSDVFGGTFSQVYVRLDRTKASTASTGLVCSRTPASNNGTESDVQVTFPSGFTVGSVGNWTAATSSLPSGATAWPGIGNATGVSGQTVTFPSSDLNADTLYCFRWTDSGALTNPSSQTSNSGTIGTRTSGALTIDSGSFALPTNNDQVSVSASVPFAATDFAASVSTSTTGQPYPQSKEITIQVDYESNISYASPVTVEAEWTLGTVEGAGSATVDTVEYVTGSATNAYGSAAPVIDLMNRTISWEISSLPAGETASVTFKLRTTSNYTGSSQVSFDVEGRVLAQDVQSASDTLTLTYKYVSTATSTPTPGPTNTPTPGPAPTSSVTSTPTPTPTTAPASSAFTFGSIEIRQVTESLVSFLVPTSQPSTLTVRYGRSPDKLTETVAFKVPSRSHTPTVSSLLPDTAYYFRFEAVNVSGSTIRSDIYLVATARPSAPAEIDSKSLVVVSNNVILLQNSVDVGSAVVIPRDNNYSFRFSFQKKVTIEEIRVGVRGADVLGMYTTVFAAEPHENQAQLVETSPGMFNGLLHTPDALGIYAVFVRARDEYGNLEEFDLFNVKVTDPMMIIDKKTKEPVQGAYIELFIFSPSRQDYVPITPEMFPLSDSQFTDYLGEASYVLPNGRYLARISAPGYRNEEVEFAIGPKKGDELPSVALTSSGLNFTTFFTYYGTIIWHECQSIVFSVQEFAASHRLLGATALFIMLAFVILTYLSFHKRLRIPLRHHLPYFQHIVTGSKIEKSPSHPSDVKLVEREFVSVIFEYLLVSSFILEIFFTAIFGLGKTAVFLALSIVNLILWILHLVHEDKHED